MHIVYITHFFPPKYNAGTANYTLGLAKAFADEGHEVEVACAEDWDSGEEYWNGVTEDVFNGTRVHRIHLNWMKASNPNQVLYDSVRVERWFDQFLKAMKPDVVHITSTMSLGVGILRSVHRAGIPLVLIGYFGGPSTRLHLRTTVTSTYWWQSIDCVARPIRSQPLSRRPG